LLKGIDIALVIRHNTGIKNPPLKESPVTSAIPVGVGTTFRYTYADGNPLWKVTKRLARDTFEAVSQDDPIEINGQIYKGDYAGVVKAFRGADIRSSLQFERTWEKIGKEGEAKASTLRVGQIVHYDNGFAQFVRCEVVKAGPKPELKPIGLIGNWQQNDLAVRNPDGSIRRGTYAAFIAGDRDSLFGHGEKTMSPAGSNIWELKDAEQKTWSMRGCRPPTPTQTVNFPRYEAPFDPAREPLLSLDLPDMTEDEAEAARLHQLRRALIERLNDETITRSKDPRVVFSALRGAQHDLDSKL
jgi:hypothetical protein